MSGYESKFARWMRVRMAQVGITNMDLADRVGVSRVAVSHWRIGKFTPRQYHVKRIADALRVTETTVRSKME